MFLLYRFSFSRPRSTVRERDKPSPGAPPLPPILPRPGPGTPFTPQRPEEELGAAGKRRALEPQLAERARACH